MDKYKLRIQHYPPIACNKYDLGLITSLYGNGHSGIDSVVIAGLDVCAICDATVQRVYWSDTHGNCLEYGYDNVTIRYCHMSRITVQPGQCVTKNQIVGQMGSTGSAADGMHLHLSLLIDGQLTDPLPYLTGNKNLPAEGATNDGGNDDMTIRRVIRPLNLRETADFNGKIVYKDIPRGTILVATNQTKQLQGVETYTWGKVYTVIDGKGYTGWCNLGSYWSEEA